jgi:uncharacterized protein YutD
MEYWNGDTLARMALLADMIHSQAYTYILEYMYEGTVYVVLKNAYTSAAKQRRRRRKR